MIAASKGYSDLVQLLVDYRADLNISCQGKTALILAEEKKYDVVAKVLKQAATELITLRLVRSPTTSTCDVLTLT